MYLDVKESNGSCAGPEYDAYVLLTAQSLMI